MARKKMKMRIVLKWILRSIAACSLAGPTTGCSQKTSPLDPIPPSVKPFGYKILDSVGVLPFSILQYSVKIRCSDLQTKGYSFLSFYDAGNKELLTYKSAAISSLTSQSSGNYTIAPPFTKYIQIGVETDSTAPGSLATDSLSVQLNLGVPAISKVPVCNLDEYMIPFWKSDTIFNETVLMYSVSGAPATGRLLFMPDKIISIKKFDLSKAFVEGSDFTVLDNNITKTSGSDMPARTAASFDTLHDLAWYDLQSQWVVVTYTHQDAWNGPVPVYKGDQLPGVLAKLKAKSPVKMIAFGMSITRGLDVSSYDDVAPYMPTYISLFTDQLKKNYNYPDITCVNAGLPGSIVSWGAMYAEKYINPVQPDLVILDFGMNDFWRYTPAEFKTYIQTIISKVKTGLPAAEFLLISNMDFDPDYILPTDQYKNFYVSNMQGYKDVLRQLESTGIINLDMTSISDAIYQKKKAKDCIANPLHPNDYLARWYAQGLTALLNP